MRPRARRGASEGGCSTRGVIGGEPFEMSWLALHRSPELFALLEEDPKGFCLLSLIAARARFQEDPCLVTGLRYGQAFVGDFRKAGIASRQAYRNSIRRLADRGFVTIQGTNKGTIVTLLPQAIYTIGHPPKEPPKEPTKNQQGTNQEPLTNKGTRKQGNNEEGERPRPPNFEDVKKFAASAPLGIKAECFEAFFDEMEATEWTYRGAACVKPSAWQARFRRFATNWINNERR